MHAVLITAAAVAIAGSAPRPGPFQRLLAPQPRIPHEEPIDAAELGVDLLENRQSKPAGGGTAKRRVSDRTQRPLITRFRSRHANELRPRRTTTSKDEPSGRRHRRGDRRRRRAQPG